MLYIIDGYNVMHAKQYCLSKEGTFEKQRTIFVECLSQYAISEKKSIQVVFDGSDNLPSKQVRKDGVSLIFTQKNQTADQAMLDIVESHQYPKSLRVVSSDKFVMDNAKRLGATAITSQSFLDILQTTLLGSPNPNQLSDEKQHGISKHDAKLWRDIFKM